MAEDQKDKQSKFEECCKGNPFEIMRKMMDQKGGGSLCTEMVKKITEARKAGRSFNCAEMMEKMKNQFGGAQ